MGKATIKETNQASSQEEINAPQPPPSIWSTLIEKDMAADIKNAIKNENSILLYLA